MSRLVRYSTALCILGIVKSRTFCTRFKESGADDFVDEAADAFFAKSLDKIQEVVEIISAVESISGSLPKTSHIFRSWYIDVGSEPWNLFLTCLLAIVGLKSISGDPLPKTILSSLVESSWWDHITRIWSNTSWVLPDRNQSLKIYEESL